MITYILLILWALFIVAVLTILFQKISAFEFKDFEDTEIPYITMDIQGNMFNMIVDTGCAVSMLNIPAINKCELLYQKTDKEVSLAALTDDSLESKAINVKFNIGKKEVSEDFYLQNHEDFANFNKWHNIEIHGLLGSSFFDKNNCKIDYGNHSLTI